MTKQNKQTFDPTPIRVAMASKNLSPSEAAKRCELAELTFRKIRDGQDVNLRNLKKAAKGLGLKVNIVLEPIAA